MSYSKKGLSFVIPAYNEEKSIVDTINRVYAVLGGLGIPFEVIVVNDGSTDRTKELAMKTDNVKVINHPVNIGYGNSLKSGIRDAQYDWIGIVDADGSYPIEEIPRLIEEMKNGFDMIIGTRTNTGQLDKRIKKVFRWLFKILIKLVIKNNIEDANSGLRVFKREMALNFLPFLCGTFSFTTSLTILAMGRDCFVKHIPIQYHPREGGSKVRHIRDSILTLQYIIQGITFYNPIKFFMILATFVIMVVCIPSMVLALFWMHTLSLYYMIFGTTVTLLIALGVLGDIIRISLAQMAENISKQQKNP